MLTHSEKLLQLLFDAFEQHVFQLHAFVGTLGYYLLHFQTSTHHHRQRPKTDYSNLHKLFQCSRTAQTHQESDVFVLVVVIDFDVFASLL